MTIRTSYRYDELAVGMAFRSPGRTITDADLVGFAGLTGDFSGLHTSDVHAVSSRFGRRVAHGMLSLAYAHGLIWARTDELGETAGALVTLPFSERKIVARRAALELRRGSVCNLGAGISTGVSAVAAEDGIIEDIVLTNEQGFIGGAPLTGVDSGTAQNFDAMVDQPYQLDFYDGGGLDVAFLSFAGVDPAGNVNISRFGDKIVGPGGFINISQNARKVLSSATFTSGGLRIKCRNGRLEIVAEGRHRKFLKGVEQVCYKAGFAAREGRQALFVTERAVFDVGAKGLRLIEVAPGVEVERDILALMDFASEVSRDLRLMDARLFSPEPMGLDADMARAPSGRRMPRRTLP